MTSRWVRMTDPDLTRDAFLGGALFLEQPRKGYRAGVDPVLLAAAVNARSGQKVLDLGCGAGAAMLCLGARVGGLDLHGVERQPDYATLARRNGAPFGATVWQADIAALPADLRQIQFHHIIANPPYFRADAHLPSPDAGRAAAMGEVTGHQPLELWVEVAARRLLPRGYLHMIQRAERLPDLLSGCAGRLGSLEVLPLAARVGRAPEHVILRARKDGRAPFRLHAPVVLHDGAVHVSDAEDYTPEIAAVLRAGAALPWPTPKK